jgi:hypothetical protein
VVSLPTALFIILLWVVFLCGAGLGAWLCDYLLNGDRGEDSVSD